MFTSFIPYEISLFGRKKNCSFYLLIIEDLFGLQLGLIWPQSKSLGTVDQNYFILAPIS